MGKGMRAGKRPKTGGGGGKKGQMAQIQQMQAMQKQMETMQAELDEQEYTATAGGGVISATVTGRKELVIAAVNEGVRMADEAQSDEYGKLTGGLDIPGL